MRADAHAFALKTLEWENVAGEKGRDVGWNRNGKK